MTFWTTVSDAISRATGHPFTGGRHQSVGGGCINAAYRLDDGDRCFFVKVNGRDKAEMFDAEAAGLAEIAGSETVKVPQVICWGVAGDQAFLVLEHLTFGHAPAGQAALGAALAAMHRHMNPRYGWRCDNTIGSTLQPNGWCADWLSFWRESRLGFQLELAARNGYTGKLQRLGQQVLANLALWFDDDMPQPSLLHGDLWSGNWAVTEDGTPVIFDPAVYYGDRETDLAMTELFGGFGRPFYEAYQQHYPLSSGYARRKNLYNLYHIVNHVNLFGGGYLAQAEAMVESLARECS